MRSRTCAHWAAKASSSSMSWMVKVWRSVHPTVSDPRLRGPTCKRHGHPGLVARRLDDLGYRGREDQAGGPVRQDDGPAGACRGAEGQDVLQGDLGEPFPRPGGEAVGHHQPEDVAIPDPDRRTMRSEGLQPAHG